MTHKVKEYKTGSFFKPASKPEQWAPCYNDNLVRIEYSSCLLNDKPIFKIRVSDKDDTELEKYYDDIYQYLSDIDKVSNLAFIDYDYIVSLFNMKG